MNIMNITAPPIPTHPQNVFPIKKLKNPEIKPNKTKITAILSSQDDDSFSFFVLAILN